jgi:hypothetical protein
MHELRSVVRLYEHSSRAARDRLGTYAYSKPGLLKTDAIPLSTLLLSSGYADDIWPCGRECRVRLQTQSHD